MVQFVKIGMKNTREMRQFSVLHWKEIIKTKIEMNLFFPKLIYPPPPLSDKKPLKCTEDTPYSTPALIVTVQI